jgi:hypothetical protein
MPIHNIRGASAATPIDCNPSERNRPTGQAPAPGSGVSPGVVRAVTAADPRWSLLADPMKQIASYLPLRDRIALSRASHAMRNALGQLAATTLERARQLSTLSGLSAILDRIDAMPDVNDRTLVLTALARRTGCLARPHRRRAWRRVLQACDTLPAAASASVLAHLSCVPSVARMTQHGLDRGLRDSDTEECLAMLEQRLNGLPAAGQAALIFALLYAREPERAGKLYLEMPPRVPFDLARHLALVPLLPQARQWDATRLAVGFHLRSPGTPLELWRDGVAAAVRIGQPSISAWTLVALMQARTIEGPWLLSALEAPQLAWQQAIGHARSLPTAEAASVGVGLAQCLKARWAVAAWRSQAIGALWQFAVDLRFDIDQRAGMLAPCGCWLDRQQWQELWEPLLERCATEGLTPARRLCLEQLASTAPASAPQVPWGQAAWETGMAAIETALARSEEDVGPGAPERGTPRRDDGAAGLAAALCAIVAVKRQPPLPGAAAFDRLLGCIDRLPPAWRGEPLGEALAWVDGKLHAGIVGPRLAALAPLERAKLLVRLLQAEPRSSATMQAFLDALKAAAPLTDEGCTLLAQGLRIMRQRLRLLASDWLTLAADLPTWAARIELADRPTLALEFARVAITVCWLSSRELPDSAQARLLRDFGDCLTTAVKRLPMEVRQTVLVELEQGPSTQLKALDSMNASTAWILSVAETLPPAYRVDVLRRWVEADTFRNSVARMAPMMLLEEPVGAYGWQPRRAVWQAILRMPPEYLAPLLCATTDWFFSGFAVAPRWTPREDVDFAVAEAQWRQALQRLPAADRVEAEFLAMPQLATASDRAAATIRRLLDRI